MVSVIVSLILCTATLVVAKMTFWDITHTRKLADDYFEQQEKAQREIDRLEWEKRRQAIIGAKSTKEPIVVDRQSKKVTKKQTVTEPPKNTLPEEYFDVARSE